jgi:hypothetical protein
MLFHASIPADDPEHVARVVAELWRGEVLPFPPFPGAYVASAGDERRTLVEIYPRGREHVPAPGEYGTRVNPAPSHYSEAHLAVGTVLSAEDVLTLAQREGWLAQRSNRAGLFEVVELWVENKFLLEVLTEAEQRRYVANTGTAELRRLFATQTTRGS